MTILNTFEYASDGWSWLLAILVGIFLACLIFFWFSVSCAKLKSTISFGVTLLGLAVLLSVLLNAKVEKTRYEVSFDEDYPVSELIENYDIVGRRGDILILEDRVEE